MRNNSLKKINFILFFLFFSTSLVAEVNRDLPYPKNLHTIDAKEIAKQIYFVNHQLYLKNQVIESQGKRDKKKSILIVKKAANKKPYSYYLNRYFNNEYDDGIIKSKDMIIFTSGKIKGLGVLMKEYVDEKKSLDVFIYFPALRKTRRMAEPTKDSPYGATDIAFIEEVKTRNLSEESSELLEIKKMDFTFKLLEIKASDLNMYTTHLPQTSEQQIADVYVLKSIPKKETWYDYRIDYVDTKYFTVYRSQFFKNDEIIQYIDREWFKLDKFEDPRAWMWKYWYTVDSNNFESIYYIPKEIIKNNQNIKERFWSEKTLKRVKR